MLRILLSSVLVLSSFHVSFQQAFAEANSLQEEAVRDITEVDCSIAQLTADLNGFRGQAQTMVAEQAARLETRDNFIQHKRQQYYDELEEFVIVTPAELLAEPLEDKMTDVIGAAGDKVLKKAARASGVSKKAAEIGSKIAGAAFRYGLVLNEIAEEWGSVVDKASDYLELQDKQREIDAASAEFSALRGQIRAASQTAKTLEQSRLTKTDIWEERGAVFDRSFYGEPSDCGTKPQTFDGVWTIDGDIAPYFEIRGNTVKELQADNGGMDCPTASSSFDYRSADEAEFSTTISCVQKIVVTHHFVKDGNTYTWQFCNSGEECILSNGYFPREIIKVAD